MRFDGAAKWYLGAGLAAVLVLVAGMFLLVNPARSNADDINTQAQAQQQINSVTQAKINALKIQYQNLPTLQKQLAGIQVHIPQTPQTASLLRALSAAAANARVDLKSVSPANPTPLATGSKASTSGGSDPTQLLTSGQVNDLPVAIALQGDFPNIELFLNNLEQMPRSVLVTGVEVDRATTAVSSTTTANGELLANISAHVFYANPGIPAAAVTTTGGNTPASSTGNGAES
jgi:Tfp pilus assembly protein PilO